MHAARMSIEQQRLDYEEAEKKRKAEEDARDMEKLKAAARAEVHALEDKANGGAAQRQSNAVPWWDGPKPTGKIGGALKQVDCLGSQARLIIEGDDRKTVKLLVADPAQSGHRRTRPDCARMRRAQGRGAWSSNTFPRPTHASGRWAKWLSIEFQ